MMMMESTYELDFSELCDPAEIEHGRNKPFYSNSTLQKLKATATSLPPFFPPQGPDP